ncbi:lytic transglycosylase domain-containing protein [Streptacidiphilus fuscans]|uniref:lytic transglycosylase domain-containing protein n=1 Tax=Streptacidiphilus fuscans TaxID=2789292 RepID=UPI001C076A80|nr:lytic transglycosylase domain-containing protein [Streptacidiphilus fuscans]
MQAAYLDAQRSIAASDPGCHLPWTVLAGIGQVESGQADNGNLTANGTTRTPILGPVLNGTSGNAAIPATGGGWARAEGPMQFIPSTWATWGTDGNDDHIADPNNVYDAALAAGHYLCADARDLANTTDLNAAILSYNDSPAYLATVTAWITYYQHHTTPNPDPSSTPLTASSITTPTASHTAPNTSAAHPTSAPTPTGTRTPQPPAPTRSASPTNTGRPSPTASTSPTATPSNPPTPSPVCTPTSGSPTPTSTATPTPSGTPTPTPTPTSTGSPTASPTPPNCPTPTGPPTPTTTPSR